MKRAVLILVLGGFWVGLVVDQIAPAAVHRLFYEAPALMVILAVGLLVRRTD